MLIHINIKNLHMSILFCTFVVEIRNIVITPKKEKEAMKYKVEARKADTHEVCDRWYANTLVEACNIVERQRQHDYAYGECDEYDYETHPIN